MIIAATTIVPETMEAKEGSIEVSVVTAIPVKTSDTPECGNSVKPRYLVTSVQAPVNFPPIYAPPVLPMALDTI